jgi:hypothetical protein
VGHLTAAEKKVETWKRRTVAHMNKLAEGWVQEYKEIRAGATAAY